VVEQACSQRTPLTAIELRRLEFEIVRKIAKTFGVML
jgi:hypothetical protein